MRNCFLNRTKTRKHTFIFLKVVSLELLCSSRFPKSPYFPNYIVILTGCLH